MMALCISLRRRIIVGLGGCSVAVFVEPASLQRWGDVLLKSSPCCAEVERRLTRCESQDCVERQVQKLSLPCEVDADRPDLEAVVDITQHVT